MECVLSPNLFKLQLQLRSLLERADDDIAGRFLTTLTKLSAREQEIALKVFSRSLSRQRLTPANEEEVTVEDRTLVDLAVERARRNPETA